jgi:RNA polymerase sigma factor (sigma-70 family)
MADTYTNDIDPITGAQQAQYQVNGINYISDNDDIIPRDAAGNIILTESGSNNPLLIINPVAEQITTTSIIRALDTAFQYYKFPVSIIATTSSVDLNLDLNIDLAIDTDPIYARYRPSRNYEVDPGGVSGIYQITGTLMDVVVDGAIQSETNKYTITKEIKNSGADLRFRVKMNHVYLNPFQRENGETIFSIIKDATPSVESNLISTQIGCDLRKIIEELPLDQQEVLKMRFFQEMTFKEISEATNVSMNTSLGRMRYAINNMRKIIEKNQIYLTA